MNSLHNQPLGMTIEDSEEVLCRACGGTGHRHRHLRNGDRIEYPCRICEGKGSYQEVRIIMQPTTPTPDVVVESKE